MSNETKATYEDANLILRLYELRREEKLREARAWYVSQFNPRTVDDVLAVLAPAHPQNAFFRMVVSYWDMAASFAVHGPLDAALLLESSGELIGVWTKIEPFIEEIRKRLELPEFLRNLEAIIPLVVWAPGRVEWIKTWIARRQAAADSTSDQ